MVTAIRSLGHGPAPWRVEARALVALGVPLVLTNLGWIAIQTTDVVMIGWLGPEALAASVLGANVSFVLLVFCMGIVLATAPMIAQDLGRQLHAVREPRRTARQGFWAAAVLGVPALVLLWHIAPILGLLGQQPSLIAGAEEYVHAYMWGFVPALWFIGLRNFISALERPRAGLVIMLLGVGFNAVAAYALIFGALGMPRLGLQGAGLAGALTNWFLCLGLLAFVQVDRRFRRYRLLGRLWRADWPRLREIFRIGLPIGMTMTLEVGLFAAAAFLMGLIGTAELAAHQIALQCAAVTFMVPLGLSQAATVRVGLAAGRSDASGVLRAGAIALGLGIGFMAATALVMWTMPDKIGALFLDVADPANAPVLASAVIFLSVAALFQIFDGAQAIGAGALRGLKDTRWPMAFAGVGYWLVGLGSAAGLAFGFGLGGLGIWIGLAVGLAATAVLMVVRFFALARPVAVRGRSFAGAPVV